MESVRLRLVTAAAWRVVMLETLISTAINALIPSGIIWLLSVAPPQNLTSAVPGIVCGTALPIFFMTLLLTLALHRRRRAGHLPPWFSGRNKRRELPTFGALLWRSTRFALAGVATLAPAAIGIIYIVGLVPMNQHQFALFNVGYGAIVGIAVTPFVVWAALAET